MLHLFKNCLLLFACLWLIGCATVNKNDPSYNSQDPWMSWNKKTFAFNETLDKYILKPVAQTYDDYSPQPIKTGISNAFNNLADVGNFFNGVLQLDLEIASINILRVLFNSTFGIFGLFDFASAIHIKKSETSLSMTLYKYGISSGPYLMVPFFGASDVRSFGSWAVINPYIYPLNEKAIASIYPDTKHYNGYLIALNIIQIRAGLLNIETVIVGNRYNFVRDAFLQARKFQEQGGEVVSDDFSDGDEDDDSDEDDF